MSNESVTYTNNPNEDYSWTSFTTDTSYSVPSAWVDGDVNMDEEQEQLLTYSAIRDRLEKFQNGEEELSTPERRHLEQLLTVLQLGQQMSQCHDRTNKSLRDIATTNQKSLNRLDTMYVYLKGRTSDTLLTNSNSIAVVLLPTVLAGGIAGALIGKLIGV